MKAARQIISIPFIWGVLPSTLVMHLAVFIYQLICFPLYGIERIRLRDYICFDREELSYLTPVDKLNCAYCSYVNGFFAYASEIGHRTEYYWCGIKHKNQPTNPAFSYQSKFAAYGSKKEYEEVLVASGRDDPE